MLLFQDIDVAIVAPQCLCLGLFSIIVREILRRPSLENVRPVCTDRPRLLLQLGIGFTRQQYRQTFQMRIQIQLLF